MNISNMASTKKIEDISKDKSSIKIFPDKPITRKPIGTRMGKGKGAVEFWVANVKPGRILFELADVTEDVAKEALRLAANKLSVKCKFVQKETEIGGEIDEDK